MKKHLRAWLLEWPMQPLALAACEVIELIAEPEIHDVPFGADWCRSLVYWRERLLPLASASNGRDEPSIVVIAYQLGARSPLQYAAIGARCMPRLIEILTDADCEPPPECFFSPAQLRACFNYDGRTLVVPDLASWFGGRA
jgi:hypothetical protein